MLKNIFQSKYMVFALLFGMSVLSAQEKIDSLSLAQSSPSSSSTSQQNQVQNSWKPYFTKTACFQKVTPYYANLNTGIGFLYFSGSTGGYSSVGRNDYDFAASSSWKNGWQYNKTLLNEALLGWNLGGTYSRLTWLGLALSVQTQNGVTVTNVQNLADMQGSRGVGQFISNLSLTAIALKAYFYFPYSLILRGVSYSTYLGLGVGPSWQSWTRSLVSYSGSLDVRFHDKISANCFFGSEVGFKIRSILPNSSLTGLIGIKFNIWGQAREMGRARDQELRGHHSSALPFYALNQPIQVKTVYQWAPFIGFTWPF